MARNKKAGNVELLIGYVQQDVECCAFCASVQYLDNQSYPLWNCVRIAKFEGVRERLVGPADKCSLFTDMTEDTCE